MAACRSRVIPQAEVRRRLIGDAKSAADDVRSQGSRFGGSDIHLLGNLDRVIDLDPQGSAPTWQGALPRCIPNAEIRLLTWVDDPRIVERLAPETPISGADRVYVEPIWRQQTQDLHQTWNIDCGSRFRAKLALGFGHALFGSAFSARPYEKMLRRALWYGQRSANAPPLIEGKGFWDPQDAFLTRYFTHTGAFTLLFSRTPQGAWLSAFMPDGMYTTTLILPGDQMLPSDRFRAFSDNFVVVLYPALDRFVGALSLFEFMRHRSGEAPVPELVDIQTLQKTVAQIEAEVAKFDLPVGAAA